MKDFQVSKFANFFLVGIDHQSANIDVREKFSLSQEQASHIIYDYKKEGGDGLMILSTCNRTELYGFGNCPRNIIQLFCRHTGNDLSLFAQYENIKQNREAIQHLFRVSSGLESKILGDFEIIGQVKKSFVFAKEQGSGNAFLERLVNHAIQVSKRVKNETGLSNGAASVAFAAVQHVKNFMLSNPSPKVILYGTGKIGKTACENLVNQTGLKNITLVNRTEEKAERLATRFGVQSLGYDRLGDGLDEADVVIIATGASEPTVDTHHFPASKHRLVLDLSVPRNAGPGIYRHPDFKVVDIDHLSLITSESIRKREKQVPAALKIIDQVTEEFYMWLESRKVAPTLQAVRQKMDHWKKSELQSLSRKFPNLDMDQAEAFASQMLNRITGQFARQLKNGDNINNDLRTIHHIFELEKEGLEN